ncbi:MAG TPA: DUF1569 domain-containing protein [Tepidisphaeraceae bacterium]|jgi:hypothetical protein
MSSRPKRRRIKFHEPSEITREAQRLLAAGYDRAGRWSLGKICRHITQAIYASRDGFGGWRIPGGSVLGKPALWLILASEWVPPGVRIPRAAKPQEPASEEGAVGEMGEAIAILQNHAGPWAPHPLFGHMSTAQWRRYHLIHAAHHFSFLLPRGG